MWGKTPLRERCPWLLLPSDANVERFGFANFGIMIRCPVGLIDLFLASTAANKWQSGIETNKH